MKRNRLLLFPNSVGYSKGCRRPHSSRSRPSLSLNTALTIWCWRFGTHPRSQWQTAYAYRRRGSTIDRKYSVEGIYARSVPVPQSKGDSISQEFLNEVKMVVVGAVERIRAEAEGN